MYYVLKFQTVLGEVETQKRSAKIHKSERVCQTTFRFYNIDPNSESKFSK